MTTMKAWTCAGYGADGDPSDAIAKLELSEIAIPTPVAGQVQVKISHAAVNPIDWKLFSGGLHGICPCTFPYVPGFDVAGTVSAVGECVSDFAVGDTVCVDLGLVETCVDPTPAQGCGGAFAEYAVAPASLVAKSGTLDGPTAAALPLAGLTAYQGLFTKSARTFTGDPLGDVTSGDKVLVLGGATLVGSYAVQLAKNAGATVACTASMNATPDGRTKVALCESLGADVVIDYKSASWSERLAGQEYDMIFDCVGSNDDWAASAKVLKKGGLFLSIANFDADPAANGACVFKNFLLKSDGKDLADLVAMVEQKTLKVTIDSTVKMADAPSALAKSFKSENVGKIVVAVADSQ
jgi:NADPH:quinone reductase-like Zn-dependent oxidoreductase